MREAHSNLRVLIVYYSRFGTVQALAEQVAEGAREVSGVEVDLLQVAERPISELLPGEDQHAMEGRRAAIASRFFNADAIVVGSPAYFGSVASPIKRLFEDVAVSETPPVTDRSRPWRHRLFRDKAGAAFASAATPHGGIEATLLSLLTLMMHMGMILVTPGQREPLFTHMAAPYGATAVAGPAGNQEPSEPEQAAARELGRRVTEVATWLDLGRLAWERELGRKTRGVGTTGSDVEHEESPGSPG